MYKSTMTKSFEQIQTPILPKKIIQIVTVLARDIRRAARGRAVEPKQLEAAYATLHMRIYQHYGAAVPKELMNQAYAELERILDDDHLAPAISNLRSAVSGRFF